MHSSNPLNIYKGPDSLKQFFDPDHQPPLPLVELPPKLNPFSEKNVRIFAKLLTALPAQNVKALPALNMLLHEPSAADKRIVEASSGSTVTSLGITSRVLYGNCDTTAFCTNKTEINRLRQLQFYGLQVELYGGPAQPEFTDPRGIIERVRQLAREDEDVLNPAQYDNTHNWKSHLRWTGPQIWKQLPEINVFCTGMGSAGCVTGTGKYLKSQKSSVKVVGVCNAESDPVPGPRALPLFDSCSFPWKDVVDYIEVVDSVHSYRLSMHLSREGIIAGPSSGMAFQGLLNFLRKEEKLGRLDLQRDDGTGELCCVFVCCDLPHQYMDGYFQRLGPEEFREMKNRDLLYIDQDVYDLKWEIDYTQRYRAIPSEVSSVHKSCFCFESHCQSAGKCSNAHKPDDILFLDLRQSLDFENDHIAGSVNRPLPHLNEESNSPFDFDDTSELKRQWHGLQEHLRDPQVATVLQLVDEEPRPVVVVLDYNGDTSRIATAILRSKGVRAFSFLHGMPGFHRFASGKGAKART